jgi:hypothetical protein
MSLVVGLLLSLVCLLRLVWPRKRRPAKPHKQPTDQARRRGDSNRPTSSPVWHPVLFAIVPALSLAADHAALLTINRRVLAIAALMLSSAGLSFLTLRSITKSGQKAGAIVSLSLLLFSSYGHAFQFLSTRLHRLRLAHRHLVLVWGAIEFLAVQQALRATSKLEPITEFLNLMAGSLVALSLGQYAIWLSQPGIHRRLAEERISGR